MRFFCLAFVLLATSTQSMAQDAPQSIAPEVFATCEAKFPTDFKQQLACVKEQLEAFNALNDLKKPLKRQIVVKPVVEEAEPETVTEEEVDDAPAPAVATKAIADETAADGFDETAAKRYCDTQNGGISGSESWKRCMAEEADAYEELADARANINTDIAGNPTLACESFTMAYQPVGHGWEPSQKLMLNCYRAKKPTFAFVGCYESYLGQRYSRDVTSIAAIYAKDVARCFNKAVARD